MQKASDIVTYHDFTMWSQRIDPEDRLVIINEEDFPEKAILSGLGLSSSPLKHSFGITNKKEIRERLELSTFLCRNPRVIAALQKMNSVPELPMSAEAFMMYVNPTKEHNLLWDHVHNFLHLIHDFDHVPTRLALLRDDLVKALWLEKANRRMTDDVLSKVENMSMIEGEIDLVVSDPMCGISLKADRDSVDFIGHKNYSCSLNNIRYKDIPEWVGWKFSSFWSLGIAPIISTVVHFQNETLKESAYEERIMDSLPDDFFSDLETIVMARLKEVFSGDVLYNLDNCKLHVAFSYGADGLKVQVYGIDYSGNQSITNLLKFGNVESYSAKRASLVSDFRKRFDKKYIDHKKETLTAGIRQVMIKESEDFFETTWKAQSNALDVTCKWYALDTLYESSENSDLHMTVEKFRGYYTNHFNRLRLVVDLAEKINLAAKKSKTSICSVEVLSDDCHTVSTDIVFPIHLLSRTDIGQVKPFKDLPKLNGQMIGFSGAHASGKTVSALTVTDNIFLAQSGIPPLGSGKFAFNVKDVLGLCFVENGDGSTAQLQLRKLNNIVTQTENIPGNKVVVVLDELGFGTQDYNGLKLGKKVLNALKKRGVTILYSSQILDLSEWAVSEWNAEVFYIDSKHRIKKGIKDGDFSALCKIERVHKDLRF